MDTKLIVLTLAMLSACSSLSNNKSTTFLGQTAPGMNEFDSTTKQDKEEADWWGKFYGTKQAKDESAWW